MRRKRSARLNGIARLVCKGRDGDRERYWCLALGVVSTPSLRETITSKNGINVEE